MIPINCGSAKLIEVVLVVKKVHEVVPSVYSRYLQHIFLENSRGHFAIMLEDFSGWKVEVIVDILHGDEISVGREHLQSSRRQVFSSRVRKPAQ